MSFFLTPWITMAGWPPSPSMVGWGRPYLETAIAERPSAAVAPTQGPHLLRARPALTLFQPIQRGQEGADSLVTLFSFS